MIRLLEVRSARKRIFEDLVTMAEAFLGLSASVLRAPRQWIVYRRSLKKSSELPLTALGRTLEPRAILLNKKFLPRRRLSSGEIVEASLGCLSVQNCFKCYRVDVPPHFPSEPSGIEPGTRGSSAAPLGQLPGFPAQGCYPLFSLGDVDFLSQAGTPGAIFPL